MYNCVGQIHSLAFQQLITGEYIHHHISIFFRSSEAEHGRMRCIKFRICLIEPNGRFYRRTVIFAGEKNGVGLSRHFFALSIFYDCFQHIRSGRKVSPLNRHFFVGSKCTCCSRILVQLLEVRIFRLIEGECTFYFNRLPIQILYLKYSVKRLILTGLLF